MNERNRFNLCKHLLAVMVIVSVAGCSNLFFAAPDASPPLVQEPPSQAAMTQPERDRAFEAAYAEGLRRVERNEIGLALGAFERAVALKPNSLEASFNLGACHEALGDPMQAIGVYRRILGVHPNDADCYHNLGTSYIKLYHRENSPVWRKLARKAWRRSLELNPDQADVNAYLAQTDTSDY